MHRRAMSWVAVVVAVVFAAACGGSSSPSSPSGAGSVAIKGVVLGAVGTSAPLTASSGSRVAAGSSTSITVTIEGTGITTTVSANGTFELTGVPGGTFTLVFTQNGVEIGRVQVTAGAGSEVKIVVRVQGPTTLIVIQLEVEEANGASPSPSPSPSASPGTGTCGIDGGKVGSGIELEGNVSSGTYAAFKMAVNGERSSVVVDVSAATASFKCNGGDKLNDDACKATVKTGAKVHVRGALDTCTTSAASVTATEVMVQKD